MEKQLYSAIGVGLRRLRPMSSFLFMASCPIPSNLLHVLCYGHTGHPVIEWPNERAVGHSIDMEVRGGIHRTTERYGGKCRISLREMKTEEAVRLL